MSLCLLEFFRPQQGIGQICQAGQGEDEAEDLIEHLETLETDRVPIEHIEEEQRQDDQDEFEHSPLPFSTM
jgi:hypothetical protein